MDRPKLKNCIGVAVLLAFNGTTAAQTLQETVQHAVATNPQVLTVVQRKEAADAGIGIAHGGYLPRIDLQYGVGRASTKNPTTIAAGDDWVDLWRRQSSAVINQMLWDGFGVRSEVERRRAISKSTSHRVYGTAEEIGMQAIDAYLDVLRNRELVGFAKENLQAHQRTFDQIRLRSDQGVGRRADLDQTDARLALTVSNLESAESSLRDAEIAFERIVGRPPGNLAPPPPPLTPRTLAEAMSIALDNHPILKSARADVDAAIAQREAAKALLSPRIELEGVYNANKNLQGVPGPYNEKSLMLWARWNAYRGGSDYYRVKETAFQIDEAAEIANNTRRQVESAVRLALNAQQTARSRLPSLERYVKSANATRDAYSRQFNIGQRTLLDLLDSENEYYTARATQLAGKYIELAAQYRLLNATGQLLSSLNIAPPPQATPIY
jgi:outer membrane protein, adhesin transport system